MNSADIATATPEQLAPILLAAMRRLGELGRDGASAFAFLVKDDDYEFDEGFDWIATIAEGRFI
jgi:hypothetical protein